MKVKYLTLNKRLTFEVEGDTVKDIFEELASIQEVFDAEQKCGVCGGTDIRFLHRTTTKNGKVYDYFHFVCRTPDERGHVCNARFDFGQAMDKENLFPKRKDDNGNWKPNNGWSRYKKDGDDSDSRPQAQSDGRDEAPWE